MASGKQKGTILIMVLWAISFLTVLAVTISVGVRQQITLASRLEHRAVLRRAAESGISLAVGLVQNVLSQSADFYWDRTNKQQLMNNPSLLKQVKFGEAVCDIGYENEGQKIYGVTDEESRINLNRADLATITRLVATVLVLGKAEAEDLARAIVDWREELPIEMQGFYSQDYYSQLEFPYAPKHRPYERLEELLLVRGMDQDRYARLKDYVTIYGLGAVNINTASRPVLAALGMSESLIVKILSARSGMDGQEGTSDDFIFDHDNNNAAIFSEFVPLSEEERAEYDLFIGQGRLVLASTFFRAESVAQITASNRQEKRVITSIFSGRDGKIIYWREESS